MELVKVVFTTIKEEALFIIKKYNLSHIQKDLGMSFIYEWKRGDDEERIILAFYENNTGDISALVTYIYENYDVHKFVNIGVASNFWSVDLKVGDVVLPNTIVKYDTLIPSPLFLDYAVWENFDLHKFGLIMNGICITGNQFLWDIEKENIVKEEYGECIVDNDAFLVLSEVLKFNALDVCVVIKWISDWVDDTSIIDNSFAILDTIL